MTALLWFRRDLRLHDHPALRACVEEGRPVVPVFCLDPRLLGGRHASGPRTQFLLECLADLDASLRRRGSALVVRHGRAEQVLPSLARELEASSVFWTRDVSPFAERRDRTIAAQLDALGAEVRALPGAFTVDDPQAVLSSTGQPYRVFTPFYRAWLKCVRREVVAAPRFIPGPTPGVDPGRIPALRKLGLETTAQGADPGGEHAGRRRMRRFLAGPVAGYGQGLDDLGAGASSRLSAYLHFGCISPRELEAQLPGGAGAEEFRRQLCWRDFYGHVLAHFPGNAHHEFQARYRGSLRWSRARGRFQAWCEGRTGYPLVDAAMRQLRHEGWMPNRARLVVGSFLTKDLGLDWRWGERWFMRLLIDGDEANNNGNWQWIASVGVDPAPVSRRIYNPTRQQARFDPGGSYVRRFVTELRRVPAEYLTEPWTMPEEVQHESRCVVGRDYPAPIVDHAAARREALARYRRAARS